jgi:hypothetical protein
MFQCERCGTRWWAVRLEPGRVRPQLAVIYDGDEDSTDELMEGFRMPEALFAPAYWQVIVSGAQWDAYVTGHHLSFQTRALHFLNGVRALLRRAS